VNEDARRVYRRFSTFFLVTGLVFVVLGVLRASLAPDVLRGNPLPVALLLLAIGAGLRRTVRRAGPSPEDGPAVGGTDVGGAGLRDERVEGGAATPDAEREDRASEAPPDR
jgi:hypothetical protein